MLRPQPSFSTPPSAGLRLLAARLTERCSRPVISFLGSPSGSASYTLILFIMGASKSMPSLESMSHFHPIPPRRADGFVSRLRRRAQRGMTLAETMIATMVFCMGILGVYAMMIKSYELVTLARHRDNSRAMLLSFADQFLRLQTTDLISGSIVTRDMFVTTASPTGVGLDWTDTAGNQVVGTTSGLPVVLGDATSSQVPATITRAVTNIDSTTGNAAAGVTATAAGWMLQATFTITYNIKGRPQTQSVIVARSVK